MRKGDSSSQLLDLVRIRFRGDADAEDALTRVESNPANAGALTALERVLVLRLVHDQVFFANVTRLVEQELEPLG
ncbi:hypothetical protein [Nonomuraea rhizosphaerae]|uniref:hypothetical protein n=1 Tax=Nonomuraea rhizosphaerae TaxID=2665663 RepID=UPI001C5D40AF|nr:hypothetical protein [Nonomuraea rhizosphaerae]